MLVHKQCTSGCNAAPSPRLQRCLDAAVAAGAPLEWLQERYPSLRGKHMHQVRRSSSSSDSLQRAALHTLCALFMLRNSWFVEGAAHGTPCRTTNNYPPTVLHAL